MLFLEVYLHLFNFIYIHIRKNTEAIKGPVTVSRGATDAKVQDYNSRGDLSLRVYICGNIHCRYHLLSL